MKSNFCVAFKWNWMVFKANEQQQKKNIYSMALDELEQIIKVLMQHCIIYYYQFSTQKLTTTTTTNYEFGSYNIVHNKIK